MKKLLWFGAGFIVVLLVLLYFIAPSPLLEQAKNAERSSAGLYRHVIDAGDHRITYLEGGKGDAVILLHGFGGEKDNWTRFAGGLTRDYRVVIPDLPGFGESTRNISARYDIENQVERLNRFVEAMKLDRFHLAGNSMGGTIAAVYAVKYPQKITTLSLFAPAGVNSPNKSEVMKMLERGVNPLMIGNRDDFDRLFNLLFVKPPEIPGRFKDILAGQAIANRSFNEKVWNELVASKMSLEPFLPQIQAPVLVVWGSRDMILDVSSVQVFERVLKKRQTIIMDDTGHVPMLEKPKETAALLNDFIRKTGSR